MANTNEQDIMLHAALVLKNQLDRTQDAIRMHRDFRGDDRCWMDDEELYKILPEGYIPPPHDTRVELANCKRYIERRHNPGTEYVSPQREIERLQRRGRHWCAISLFQSFCILVWMWRLWS